MNAIAGSLMMLRVIHLRHGSRARQRGASSVEYAIVGSLIAAVIVASVLALGAKVKILFDLGVSLFS